MSETIPGRVPPLTKDHLMRGTREGMLRDDRVRFMLQQLPRMHLIQIFIFQVNKYVHLGGDSQSAESKISDVIN